MTRRRRALRSFVSVLLGTAGACTPAAEQPLVLRTDSAGVTIVQNLGGDRPLPLTYTPTLRLGGADEGPEAFYQLSPFNVDVDGAGNIYVLDSANHHVVVFSPDGRHLRTLGRKGGGPGELEYPNTMAVGADGTVHVRDISKPGMVSWTPAGEPITTEPLKILIFAPFETMGDALITTVPAPLSDDELWRQRLLAMRVEDTVEVASLIRPPVEMIDFGCVGLTLPPRFSPEIVWAADRSRVAAATGAAYHLRVLEGEQIMLVRRAVELRPVTREMAIQDVGEGMTIGFAGAREPCKIAPEVVVERQGYEAVLPAVQQIALAPGGEIWVQRKVITGEPTLIDVFTGEGEYQGTLPPDSPFPAAFTPSGDVVAIERDEMDVDRLVVYRIAPGDPT